MLTHGLTPMLTPHRDLQGFTRFEGRKGRRLDKKKRPKTSRINASFRPLWRSKRDLNPRGTFAPYALSRGREVRRKKRHNEKYTFIVDTMLTRGLDHLHAVHGVQFGVQGDMAVIISKG